MIRATFSASAAVLRELLSAGSDPG